MPYEKIEPSEYKRRYGTVAPEAKEFPDFTTIEAFVDRFLSQYSFLQGYKDYDVYYGELMNICLNAEAKYDPERGMTLNSYFFLCCRDRVRTLNKKEKRWYSLHITGMNLNGFTKGESTYSVVEMNETIEAIKASTLSGKMKEIVILYITKPFLTYEELSEFIGCSRQHIHQTLRSVRQYFARENLELEATKKPKIPISFYH